jgi:hypothetical protein
MLVSEVAAQLGLPAGSTQEQCLAEIRVRGVALAERKRIAAAAANHLTAAEIETAVKAAAAAGKIVAVDGWRTILAREGKPALRRLEAKAPIPVPEPEAPSLLDRQMASLVRSVDEGAAAKKAAEAKPVAASTGAAAGVVADPASGALSWQGLPVTLGADGSPLVNTVNGPMTPAAFTAAGLDAETERAGLQLAGLTGSLGAPTRGSLFGGGGGS